MSKLKLEVLFNAVDKVSGPIKTIIGGSQSMAAALKKTDSELKGLQATQRKVDSFRGLQATIDKTKNALAEYREEHKRLKDQAKLGSLSEEQTKKLNNLEQGIRRTKAALKSSSTEITGVTRDLNAAGIQMSQLGESESELKGKIHLTTMALNKQKEALGKHQVAQEKYEQMQSRMAKANDLAQKGLMIAGAAAVALVVPVKLSIDFESAMADVKKVVDFDTPQQFKQMENDILNMSKRLPMAAKDIAAIYAAGGQSGIAKNELTQFAETAVKMGVAFDISAAESGQAMAEMRTAFKMSQNEVTTLADKINYLGNNTPAAAKGIMEIVQRIGPLGEVGGFAAGSIAALGATIRGMGVAEEIAATGIKNMMLALVAGESATKSQKAAYKELGLDSSKVAKDMQTNAEATTLNVLKQVSKLDKYKQAATLKELFGSESLGSIAPLLTNMKALEENLGKVADKSKYAGSMEKEYAARAATTANNILLAKNSVAALGITIGNQLLPGINSITGKFTTVINSVQAWAQANPALSSTLVKVTVGAIGIVAGLSALAIGLITIFGPMMMVAKGFGIVSIAARAMSMALMTNPITWIVLAIAGAAFLIYKNWTPIKGFFLGIWSTIKTAFNGGITGISALITNWSPIGLFYSAFAKVLSWFGIDLPSKFTDFGAMMISGFINGIKSKWSEVKAEISSGMTNVIDKARDILGIHSPSRIFMGIGDYTMQGMANGISQNNRLPISATQDATQGVINSALSTKPVNPIAMINMGKFDAQGIANTFSQNNFRPSTTAQNTVPGINNATVKTQAVKPISNIGSGAKSFISKDNITITIQVKDGSVVKGTAEALRQELKRVAQEEQNARRKFLTDTE
ncbi:phage tail tape measure protein [Acinetobacter silvestris]|uniref:Phage tail tape measure protein n=1 Tax=Acinetobacter silvestris TaxID=1977882 RepID=A0A1Y3CIJ7_9GAMM|nr:phage tail tape measure protein [Acinetobacter silvestris]OTG65917.1 phage tail tape measure protein [Acinetobacter silvestris]